jgi:hypothetical protein
VSFVLLLSGCGLSDYAGQMSSEAARVHAWDEEAELLDAPLKMPVLPKKDDKDQTWSVFLRPPRGVGTAPKTAEGSSQAQLFGPLVQYERGSNRFGITNLYLGVGGDRDFAGSVLTYFGIAPGGGVITVPRSAVITGAGKKLDPSITVKQQLAEAQYAYSFNFYEHGGTQVAVVYQMDKGNGSKADKAIQASLATLGVDDEVRALNTIYAPRPKRR